MPKLIVVKLQGWVELIETQSFEEARKVPEYHDEPLSGQRRVQRSIRLSRSYRAIYEDGVSELVSVEEVSKHDY